MQDQTKQIHSDSDRTVQRAIVLQALRDDHDSSWSRAELEAELDQADPITISDALTVLKDEGVIDLAGEMVRASRAAMHLDGLGMISV
jgi:hypothetical protein